MSLNDVLAALAVVVNGLPQGLLALTYGFAAFPTAVAFAIGTVGCLLLRQVAPISFQAESIVLAGTLGRDREERLNIVIYCGLVMAVIGACGLLERVVNFVGPAILHGMMAGVGVILATVAINMVKSNYKVGGISGVVALIVYVWSKNLVYTIVASVFISSLVWVLAFRAKDGQESELSDQSLAFEKFERTRLKVNPNIVRGTLAMITLQIGGNIAYGTITGNLANTKVNVDYMTLISGVADATSAFFGGGPVEAIISGTAVAPNPLTSAVLMMGIMTVILLLKLLPKIAKYVPSESIAGFLFVLGAIVVFPTDMKLGIESHPVVSGVTAVVTAATDPFVGMVAGLVMRYLLGM